MVMAQYNANHGDPSSLLGYMAVMEEEALPSRHIQEMGRRWGVPPDAMRYFTRHATTDILHREEMGIMLDTLPEDHHAGVIASAQRTLACLEALGWRLHEYGRMNHEHLVQLAG
jgi:hypothetical protein